MRPETAKAVDALAALDRAQAIIQFDMEGTILTANENFLKLVGYALGEIKGKKHAIFVDAGEREGEAYKTFWTDLRAGTYRQSEFKRIGKDGKAFWIQGTYAPLIDRAGRPYGVIKFAVDITAQVLRNADTGGQLCALHKAQAVIEFDLDGRILTANENFLKTMGYALAEIQGKRHEIFIDPPERDSADYRKFWERLRSGEYQAGQFHRLGKGGREVWIQGAYNPIFDMEGKPYKVVKFATDITAQVAQQKRDEIHKAIDADLARITEAVSSASHEAVEAAAASTQASSNVQSVAAGAEELSASFQEIARQVGEANQITLAAAEQARKTTGFVAGLSNEAQRIGDVVRLINDIATQTNLLALNATIEAARAGEAGRGFAVVAAEVKTLATRTAKATEEIGQTVASVQNSTAQAAQAIEAIGATFQKVGEINAAVAQAVEAQSSVTADISQNMQVAAGGVEAITHSMNRIAEATTKIDEAAHKVRAISQAAA
ncbi:methyl-accepting chemotaxis protein [Rhodoblastus acidophilus]|uniref:methyl-accepting chemotaxis protein n=1 Tax=Rhodoblastus acidophilus TaxID=1074 RepID=UPI0031C6849E|nr:methyl-accepting chemotaxis protein [Rhodoblastus acidophilus]